VGTMISGKENNLADDKSSASIQGPNECLIGKFKEIIDQLYM